MKRNHRIRVAALATALVLTADMPRAVQRVDAGLAFPAAADAPEDGDFLVVAVEPEQEWSAPRAAPDSCGMPQPVIALPYEQRAALHEAIWF